jgi:hypothetical protein
VMARTVSVPGAIALIAALAGGSLLGILGAWSRSRWRRPAPDRAGGRAPPPGTRLSAVPSAHAALRRPLPRLRDHVRGAAVDGRRRRPRTVPHGTTTPSACCRRSPSPDRRRRVRRLAHGHARRWRRRVLRRCLRLRVSPDVPGSPRRPRDDWDAARAAGRYEVSSRGRTLGRRGLHPRQHARAAAGHARALLRRPRPGVPGDPGAGRRRPGAAGSPVRYEHVAGARPRSRTSTARSRRRP